MSCNQTSTSPSSIQLSTSPENIKDTISEKNPKKKRYFQADIEIILDDSLITDWHDFYYTMPLQNGKKIILSEQKKWYPAIFIYKKDTVKVKIKHHGSSPLHYYDSIYSFSIKYKDINGFKKRLKLIKGKEANPAIIFENYMGQKNALIASSGEMKMLSFNKNPASFYYIVDDIKQDFLIDNFSFSESCILKQTSDWTRKEKINYENSHWSTLDFFIGHIEHDDSPYFSKALLRYEKLIEHHKKKLSIEQFFSAHYVSNFLALASLNNDQHFFTGDNLKLIYNNNNNKFYPIYRPESIGYLPGEYIDSSFMFFDQYLFNSNQESYKEAPFNSIFQTLLSSDYIRNLRNQLLYKLFQEKANIIHIKDSIIMANKDVMESVNKHEKFAYNKAIKEQNKKIKFIFSKFEKYIKYCHIYGTYYVYSKTLKLQIDNYSSVDILLKGTEVKKNYFGISYSTKLKQFNNTLKIKNVKNLNDIIFINAITKDTIKKSIYINKIYK